MTKLFKSALLLIIAQYGWAQESYNGKLQEGSALLFSVHNGQHADRVILCDRYGHERWRNRDRLFHPQMLQALDDATILCATQDGAHIVDVSGKSIWRYTLPEKTQNCMAIQLAENRFLVGHEGPAKLVEIDKNFNTLTEIKLAQAPWKNHGQFRYVTITPQGTYLVPLLFIKTLREYDRQGHILAEVNELPQVTQAQRLDNGHTLVSLRGQLREYDKNWKVCWQYDLKKDGNLPVTPITSFCQLPEGHLLLALYHPKESPDIIEINRKKVIIHRWTFPQFSKIAHLSIVSQEHPILHKIGILDEKKIQTQAPKDGN